MSVMGKNNWVIEDAISRGMRLNPNGSIILPNGQVLIAKLPKPSEGKYRRVHFGKVTFTLARILCWLTHGPPPTPAHVVDHINRDPLDDRPENLRWATSSENGRNISDEARRDFRLDPGQSANFKMTVDQIRYVRAVAAKHRRLPRGRLMRELGLSKNTIDRAARGESWQHIA